MLARRFLRQGSLDQEGGPADRRHHDLMYDVRLLDDLSISMRVVRQLIPECARSFLPHLISALRL